MAVVMDFESGKISNRLIISGLFWGLAFRLYGEGAAGLVHFLMNISIPVILLFLLFQMRAVGAGDIKLCSVAGGFLTARQLLYVMLAAFVAGAFIGLIRLIGQAITTGYRFGTKTQIHFSTAILTAYFVVVWGCRIG